MLALVLHVIEQTFLLAAEAILPTSMGAKCAHTSLAHNVLYPFSLQNKPSVTNLANFQIPPCDSSTLLLVPKLKQDVCHAQESTLVCLRGNFSLLSSLQASGLLLRERGNLQSTNSSVCSSAVRTECSRLIHRSRHFTRTTESSCNA